MIWSATAFLILMLVVICLGLDKLQNRYRPPAEWSLVWAEAARAYREHNRTYWKG